jgi:hypothetical protein
MAMEYLIGNRARKLRRRERESNKTRLSSIFRLYIYIYFWLSGLRCQLEIGAVSEVARLLTRSLTHHFVNWVFLFYLRRRCAFWVPQCMAVTMCFFVHPLYIYIYIYIYGSHLCVFFFLKKSICLIRYMLCTFLLCIYHFWSTIMRFLMWSFKLFKIRMWMFDILVSFIKFKKYIKKVKNIDLGNPRWHHGFGVVGLSRPFEFN